MTAPDNDDIKRAEEIGYSIHTLDDGIKKVAQALSEVRSEERARTLNSEAVQGLVEFSKSIGMDYDHDSDAHKYKTPCRVCMAEEVFEKFQQFKDGK